MDSCTLYLDASGDTGWVHPFGKSKTEWYVLAGLVLTPEADLKAHRETSKILAKYVPEEVRAKFPDKMYELHYLDIIRGQRLFSHLKQEELKALADEVFNLLLELKPVLFATAINKIQLKRVYGHNAHIPNRLAMRATIGRFSIYLQRENLIGSVTYDAEEYRKDKNLQEMILGFRRFGIVLTGENYRPRMDDNLGNLLNTINMASSETSPGIQLADFCSRAVWQHFEHCKSNRFNQISALGDRGYEPSIVPAKTRWIK
ncbi:conserved protein of unknown function [Nitrosotalea devaniterrae]|uniref:DUF3800 domain-containing protein n=1 Tax=Nitrosotalea devaniterrae TaxID=1078905 RepID=A0A128A646_9ARCH|nr:conserved protein of unknown function [Candidatus Nitrosotalea devanaterra]